MVKFDASKFVTTPEPSPRKQFRFEVEDSLHHIRDLKPGLRVGWIKGHPNVLGVAPDLDTVGCMTLVSLVPLEKREPYGDIDIAVYQDMSLREVIASWEARDGEAEINATYHGTITQGCDWLGWISEPADDWDSYI